MSPAGFGLSPEGTTSNSSVPINIEESTPWVAAGDGDLELLQTSLHALELPVNARDTNGFTFCHAAAAYNQLETLRWLLNQNGCDVNVRDSDGDTPLHHCDRAEAARVLVEDGGADPYLVNNDNKTPLQAKQDELQEHETEDQDDSDVDEDTEALKQLIIYLKGLQNQS